MNITAKPHFSGVIVFPGSFNDTNGQQLYQYLKRRNPGQEPVIDCDTWHSTKTMDKTLTSTAISVEGNQFDEALVDWVTSPIESGGYGAQAYYFQKAIPFTLEYLVKAFNAFRREGLGSAFGIEDRYK